MSWFAQTVEVEPYQMLRQMRRTVEEIKKDSPCIGVCTLNEDSICIGCNRHIGDIIDNYRELAEESCTNDSQCTNNVQSLKRVKKT